MTVKRHTTWNNLSLTQQATYTIIQGESAGSALTLVDEAEIQHKIKTTSSTLNLTHELGSNQIFREFVFSNLVLSDYTIVGGTHKVETSSQLTFTDLVRNTLHARSIESVLNLTQNVDVRNAIYVSASNNLAGGWTELNPEDVIDVDPYDTEAVAALFAGKGLRQEVRVVRKNYKISVTSYLSLSHHVAPTIPLSASNHIHLSHTVETVLYEELSSLLLLQHSAVAHVVQGVEQELDLTQSVLVAGVVGESVTSTLNLKSVVSYATINLCSYSPGVGEGSFTYTPPSTTEPTLVRRATTVLTWPYSAPTKTVELRNPVFDNIEQFEFRRVNRRTRGGTLDLYRDENWPKVERLIMSFTALSDEQRTKLFDFIQRSLGQEIGLLDFENRQWKGILLTPSSDIKQSKKYGHSFSLEFEGELV